jgi:hypothetical protein
MHLILRLMSSPVSQQSHFQIFRILLGDLVKLFVVSLPHLLLLAYNTPSRVQAEIFRFVEGDRIRTLSDSIAFAPLSVVNRPLSISLEDPRCCQHGHEMSIVND